MKSRKFGILTAAAIAVGLAIAPFASFAAAPRAASQFGHTDSIQSVQQKTTIKKSAPKKQATTKKSIKKANTKKS